MSWKVEAKRLRKERKKTEEALLRTLPHYTTESVAALFAGGAPRIRMNDYETCECLSLSEQRGYFKLSDKNGGRVTFLTSDDEPQFTAAVTITDEMRQAECDNPTCTSHPRWDELLHLCNCDEHHKGQLSDLVPRLEVCDPKDCDGTHVWLLGLCNECFDSDLIDDVPLKDITADNFKILLR